MFEKILNEHFQRYPFMEVMDAYKLIHQSAMANEHYFSDAETIKEKLEVEFEEMGEGPEEPMLDPISPGGKVVRVHLRPYIQSGRDVKTLAESFISSAQNTSPRPDLIPKYWDIALQSGYWEEKKMEEFLNEMQENSFPAVHHSDVFRLKYKPAYRVVLREFLTF